MVVERTATLRSILHAAAQVLGCDSAHLARVSEDRQALLLALAVSPRGAPKLQAVETVLGFEISGQMFPLAATESLLVRTFREQRLLITQDVTEIVGDALPAEVARSVFDIVGPRSFASVPVSGRGGPLGVMLVERVRPAGFSAEERDLLLMYADRLGFELESEALAEEASRLERLGQVAASPPVLFACVPGADGLLHCHGGAEHGQALHRVLGAADGRELWSAEVEARVLGGETVSLSALRAHSTGAGQGPLRVTLRLCPGPPAGEGEGLSNKMLLCAVEDLGWSERLRREMLLAKEHLSKVMRSVGDAILTVDAAGVIQQANEASLAVLGVPPDRLCGRPARSLAATEKGRRQLTALEERLIRTGFAERQIRLRRLHPAHPEGAASFPAHLSVLLLCDETGRPAGAVWRVHDQTERRRGDAERRRLRLRLLQSERLSALGEMAARIAHEVRNPLLSIGAAAQVVAEELPPGSPLSGEVRAIGSEVRRLDAIIGDFLRFSRPRRRASRQTADVGQVVTEVVDLMRPKAEGLRLRLARAQAGAPVSALIEPDSLRQVVWNVLLNACEACRPAPEQGMEPAIECEVRQRYRRGALEGGRPERVLVAIADRGPGIPQALRRRVFDPFFSTKARGTGLGLSICKQIVEEHGGRIRLQSRSGGGTRVVIELRPAPLEAPLQAGMP